MNDLQKKWVEKQLSILHIALHSGWSADGIVDLIELIYKTSKCNKEVLKELMDFVEPYEREGKIK